VGSLERIREIDTGQLLRRGQQKRVAAASVSHRGVGEDGLKRTQDRERVGDRHAVQRHPLQKDATGGQEPQHDHPHLEPGKQAQRTDGAVGLLANQVATNAIPPM